MAVMRLTREGYDEALKCQSLVQVCRNKGRQAIPCGYLLLWLPSQINMVSAVGPGSR